MTTTTTGTALMRTIKALEFRGSRRVSSGTWTCPAHDDRKASLSVTQGKRGVLLKCHAGCTMDDVLSALQLTKASLFDAPITGRAPARATPEAVYGYTDEKGALLFEVVRFPGKAFRQRRPTPSGFAWDAKGVRRVLYRLPEILAAVRRGDTVYIVEGEKDADALAGVGVAATCNPMGAGKWKVVRGHAKLVLAGASVCIVADKDETGRRHALEVAESLKGVAREIRVVEAREGKDAAEHLAAGHGVDNFEPLARPQVLTASARATPPVGAEGSLRDDLPMVRCADDLGAQVQEAMRLLASMPNVFARSGRLVECVVDSGPSDGATAPNDPARLLPIRPGRLRELLSQASRWERPTSRGDFEPCLPPTPLIQALGDQPAWPAIRRIEGITASPVLRPDGSLLLDAGWDEATSLLYVPVGARPDVSDSPTHSDAQAAVETVLDVVCDFPFANDAHRATWLAALLTPLARHSFAGPVPLFLFEANVQGAGKGLLVRTIGLITSGRPMSVMTLSKDDSEVEKRITAMALGGTTQVLLDNISGELRSPILEAALTAPDTWEGRILGLSQLSGPLRLRMVWFATGNNLVLSADMADRIAHVRLDSPLERPRDRPEESFRRPRLATWIAENRTRLLGAALTILRAYSAAGRPRQELQPWGSFDEWSDAVRAPLVWAGLPDPAAARSGLFDASDAESRSAGELLAAWAEVGLSKGMSAADAIRSAQSATPGTPRGRLADAIADACTSIEGRRPSAQTLGFRLRALRGRVIGGRRLEQVSRGRNGQVWRVVST